MRSFKDLLRRYNTKDLIPISEAMRKMIDFHHNKDIEMLKLGCTLPNLANIFLHKPTDTKIDPITVADQQFLEKNRDFLGGQSVKLQTSGNVLLGLKLAKYTPTRCIKLSQPVIIRVGISIQKWLDSRPDKTRPIDLKIWLSYFQNTRLECEIESFYSTNGQK